MVFKRRSSTRVGRNAPRRTLSGSDLAVVPPTPSHRAATRITRPLRCDGRVFRLVDPPSGQTVVEEWTDGYWRPCYMTIGAVRASGAAPPDLLLRLGVPVADWHPHPADPWMPPTLVRLLGQLMVVSVPATSLLGLALRAAQAFCAA